MENDEEIEFTLPWKAEKEARIELVDKARYQGERTDRTAWIKIKGPKALVEQLEFFTFKQGEYIHVGISNFYIKEMVLPNNGRVNPFKRPDGVKDLMEYLT